MMAAASPCSQKLCMMRRRSRSRSCDQIASSSNVRHSSSLRVLCWSSMTLALTVTGARLPQFGAEQEHVVALLDERIGELANAHRASLVAVERDVEIGAQVSDLHRVPCNSASFCFDCSMVSSYADKTRAMYLVHRKVLFGATPRRSAHSQPEIAVGEKGVDGRCRRINVCGRHQDSALTVDDGFGGAAAGARHNRASAGHRLDVRHSQRRFRAGLAPRRRPRP